MTQYNTYVANNDKRGFINQKKILEYVSQEEIFELVFGYKPVEYVYVTSPFRLDKKPGCWFERTSSFTGKLRFVDFANEFNKPMDCFDAIQVYFRLPNFYLTLDFIYDKLISGKNRSLGVFDVPIYDKKDTSILFDSRPFFSKDGLFWEKKYGITKQNIIDDKVFPVKKYYIKDGKFGDYSSVCYDIGYAYTNFKDQRKKLYFPNRQGSKRFISTCIRNDIGGLDTLPPFGRELIVTKSYKDWRVLKNNGKHAIYFQNEGMIPDEDLLMSIFKNWTKVIIWFDNDAQGMKASKVISDIINSHFPSKSTILYLPENLNSIGISDPSDLYHKQGKAQLHEFFKTFK
jgi:5S rRNA maturation endonuclease (ribonuclease M5)